MGRCRCAPPRARASARAAGGWCDRPAETLSTLATRAEGRAKCGLFSINYFRKNPACQATCHTWQTAQQAAVAKGLISAAQHRRRRRPIVLTVHNVTTARDLQSPRAGRPRRRTSHQQLARNNFSTLQGLNAQPGVTVTLRVDAGPPPARLQHIAERAAQAGDLRSMHPADHASHANAQWDELRVWDPGD